MLCAEGRTDLKHSHTNTHTHTPYLDPHPIWTHTLEATLMDVAYMYE